MTVGYDAERGVAFVDRAHDTLASQLPDAYRDVRTSDVLSGDVLNLDILVDASSVEVFLGDGSALTMAVYPASTALTAPITVEAVDAPVTVRSLSVAPIAVLDPQRAR